MNLLNFFYFIYSYYFCKNKDFFNPEINPLVLNEQEECVNPSYNQY